ncbi:Dyp-type peroxidase, partial [Acidisphaera sp. L21]|uniref:Dyp-type peroxidase n=1 Tax=Acidisphaera sp. L21 TaxID=1641851 RepID=UPI00131DDC58
TVAVGSSLFDDRYGLAKAKPRALVPMKQFPNDALDSDFCHGDLLLQFNANTAETNIHALRDIVKNTPELLALRWKMDGFLPPHTVKKQSRDTVRNLMGFKDGTENLDPRDTSLMDRIVWVQPGADEPAWTIGGSYQVVRLIRMLVERWDRTPLQEQQTIFGRDKTEGAPLGMAHEHDKPNYATDPEGEAIPLTAHIRLANPRTKATDSSLILRRAYNFSRGLTKAGQMDMGLIFGCFQADLEKGFLTVQARLNGEALEEYIKPFGGGYFFALPGVADKSTYYGEALLNT